MNLMKKNIDKEDFFGKNRIESNKVNVSENSYQRSKKSLFQKLAYPRLVLFIFSCTRDISSSYWHNG